MIRRGIRASVALALLLLFGACRSAATPAPASDDHATASDDASPADAASPPGAEAASAAPASDRPTPALPDFGAPGWTRVTSDSGARLVCWRALGEGVPRNRDFSLEVWVFQDGEARAGLDLTVSAWMPEHSHGMLHAPRTRDRGDGSYLVEGMLFHMRGRWELRVQVDEGASTDMARCELTVR